MNTAAGPDERLRRLLRDFEIATVMTVRPGASWHGRVMLRKPVQQRRHLYFLTSSEQLHPEQLELGAAACAVFADPAVARQVSVFGHASYLRVAERIAALLREQDRDWFAEGPQDPSLCVLDLRVDRVLYWRADGGPAQPPVEDEALSGALYLSLLSD